MSRTFRSSAPDAWVHPRPFHDASSRHQAHGPIEGMSEPAMWERIVGPITRAAFRAAHAIASRSAK